MDYRIPMPDISAGERATFGSIQDLVTLGFEVTFLPGDMRRRERYTELLEGLGVEVITSGGAWRFRPNTLPNLLTSFATFYIFRIQMVEMVLPTIGTNNTSAKVIFHDPDLHFFRENREAEIKKDPEIAAKALHTQERELAIMNQVDHTVIVSPAELHELQQYLPIAAISVFPVLYVPVTQAQTLRGP